MIRHQHDMQAFATSPAECAKHVNVAVALSAHRIATVPTWKAVGSTRRRIACSAFEVTPSRDKPNKLRARPGRVRRNGGKPMTIFTIITLLVWSALVARVAYHLGYWNGQFTSVDEAVTMIPPRPEDEQKQP